MRERLKQYRRPPVFPADEEKTFTASLLHVILWSLLVGICLYTFISSIFAFIQSHLILIAWLYALALAGLALTLLVIMRRGYVRAAAISINVGLWIILTVAAYSNGGVAAPAYSGYVIVVICVSLLVSWRWGLAAVIASALAGAVFLLLGDNLPVWRPTYNPAAVWSANVAYFFVATMLLALALRAIQRAAQQARREMAERLKTEQALRHSEQRFHAIFDSVNDAIFVQDFNTGRILDANKTMCEMYGYTVEEARQLSVGDLSAVDPAFTSHEAREWWQKSVPGEPQILEWQAKDRAGRLFWVEINVRRAALDDEDRLLVVVRDIDERKRAEQRLQFKEESLRLALEAARMGTWDWQAETDQWSWSDNVGERFGLKASEPAGTFASYLDQVVEADRQQVADAMGQALTGREDRFVVEHRVRWPDGSLHWLEDRGQVFRDARGRPVRVAGTIADVTDRKRTEAELAHERDLLQALMDNFPDTIYFKDTASRFTRINRAQADMLGLAAPEDAIGKTDIDFFQDHELSQSFLLEEQHLMSSGEPIIDRVEYNPTPAGQPRWLSASKVPLRDGLGQIVGMVGISRDISDRMLAEQREKTLSQGLRAVIEATQELMDCADLDTLYRRAVELAREKLKVERCGLFALDDQGWLRGTYGTDRQGQTSDERNAHFRPVNRGGLDAGSSQLWEIVESEHAYWESDQHRIFGAGWVGTTYIRTRDRVMGVLYNDTAITQAPVDEAQQEVLAVYCSLLGSFIELKHAEEALRESEALYRRAIEAAGAVPYYLDYPTESYRFVGEGIQQLTGLTPAEMQPSTWDTLVQQAYPLGEATQQAFREAVRRARASQITVWRADYYVLTRDGRYCWVNDASVQVLDEQGQPRGAIGILQDITDRKQVELALRESEGTMRALLEAIPDAIFRFDAQGVFKDFIPAKNFAVLLPPESFIGKPYWQVLPPEMAQQLAENFQIVLEQGEPRLYEYALLMDGQPHYYESRLVKTAQGDVLGIVRDVTDRKQAELALQQREAYLRAILDNFPYWFWLKDTEGRYLAANRTLARALGLNQVEELIGKTDWDVTPTVAAKFRADDQEVIDQRSQKFVEETVIEHGVEKWFETFKSPIFDAQGQVIGTAGFSHDITARRQAEAAMRESETLFRYLADNAPAFIGMTDETTLATYLNRAWQEFRGNVPALPLDEWAEYIHPDDRRRYLHEYRSAVQARRKYTTEYRLRRSDGQYRWLLDTIVPRFTADERFAGFIGIAIDITDRKNVEEALRRSESRLRLLTDNMVDIISQIDAQQRLVYASPSSERVFGHALRDVLGRPLYEFVHPEDTSRLYQHILMATELHTPSLRLEYRYRHAAGHYLWVESEMRLLYDERGDLAGAVFGSRDISARKRAAAEREQLITELEDKNAELERFTYTVSHDLKSPLITIRGFLGFLEKDATTGNLDRLRTDIGRIVEATTRMQQLLDELLELSRIGRMSNPLTETAFAQIVQEAVALVQGRISAHGVQVQIADDLPIVYGDHLRLVEVVQNLVDNAVKFMGDQAEPRVTIGALGIERSGMPIFFVQDNGLGLEPQYHESIFGLFNKLDVKSEGTGVGLALVKRIIDFHGGQIWVESDGIGQGATFFFTLPRPTPASSSRTN